MPPRLPETRIKLENMGLVERNQTQLGSTAGGWLSGMKVAGDMTTTGRTTVSDGELSCPRTEAFHGHAEIHYIGISSRGLVHEDNPTDDRRSAIWSYALHFSQEKQPTGTDLSGLHHR